MFVITIIIEPVGPDTFASWHDGRLLVLASTEPFCAAARVLLAEGADPDATFVIRHRGSGHDALRSTIGVAAGLTIENRPNGAPRFRRWRAPCVWGVSPSMRCEGEEASGIAPDAGALSDETAEVAP